MGVALTAGSSAQSLTRLRGVAVAVVVVLLAVLFFFARLTRLDVVTAASWCVVSASCHALSRAHTHADRDACTHTATPFTPQGPVAVGVKRNFQCLPAVRPYLNCFSSINILAQV